MTRSFQIWSSV